MFKSSILLFAENAKICETSGQADYVGFQADLENK